MLGLSANLDYYLFNGNVDMRKGIFRLCEYIREELKNVSAELEGPAYKIISKVVRKLNIFG